ALRLSDDERAYLFDLACEQPDAPVGMTGEVRASILHMLDRLDDSPAFVIDAKYQVLAWNQLAAALIADFAALPARDRNLARLRFLGTSPRRYAREETLRYGREVVANLRTATARYPDDPELRALLRDLLAHSAEFAEMWAAHEVSVQRNLCKTVHHPVVGPIELFSEVLLIPDADQRLVLYTATPGTRSHEALRLLKVVGTQDLTADPAR
ncbi:MAG TPA: transcriptional regulator, partial [Micromonosporaceae bacterium]|nr:transcriptional regulator [Micromonosporaceae bacterium]